MPIEKISFEPNQNALEQVVNTIWDISQRQLQTPLVILSTSGPIFELRQTLEAKRPPVCPPEIAFLPALFGLDQWLNLTNDLKNYPNPFSDFQRWEIVFKQLEVHYEITNRLGLHGDGSKWALSQSIVQGCDYLSGAYLSLTELSERGQALNLDNVEMVFQEALQRAYPNSEQFVLPEAHILLTFWKYITSIQDPPIRRQLSWKFRIQELETIANLPPLIWIEYTQANGVELTAQEEFLKQYAIHGVVYRLTPDWSRAALWPECFPVGEQFQENKSLKDLITNNRQSAEKSHWQLISPPSFEKLAWTTVQRVAHHIQESRKNIAIIAQDRLVVRRVRALLSRYPGISIQDATGWKLSTTGVAAAVNSWIEIVRSPTGPNLHQIMGFLKNPLIDWPKLIQGVDEGSTPVDPDEFMNFIDQQLLDLMIGSGWDAIFNVFDKTTWREAPSDTTLNWEVLNDLALKVVQFIQLKTLEWHGKSQKGDYFSGLLQNQLEQFAMAENLQKDEAGLTFLQLLVDLQRMNDVNLQANSWFSLLDLSIEESSFIEKSSPYPMNISIIPLSAIRLQKYDAVIVVGCDDEHFPSKRNEGLIFSQSLMRELGLLSIEDDYQQQARDLSQLLQSHQYVDFLWQEYQKAGEKNRRSSWLTRLMIDVVDFYEKPVNPITDKVVSSYLTTSVTNLGAKHPLLPTQLSPSSYKTLRECPYRFYVTRSLKLNSPNAYREDSIYGAIGQLLHKILEIFYRALKLASEQDHQLKLNKEYRRDWMIQKLTEISANEWLAITQSNGQLLANEQAWNNQIPTFIDWQLAHENSGWTFFQSEEWFEYDFKVNEFYTIKMRGKIDRIDISDDATMVLDYKVQSLKKLKEKERQLNDDPQLFIYANALEHRNASIDRPVQTIEWVSLKPDKTDKDIILAIDATPELKNKLEQQMRDDLQSVWEGSPMRASGPNHVCQYCDVRGICRKGMWINE